MLLEYFDIPKILKEFDSIGQKELFNNLDFTIQTLIDSNSNDNEHEINFASKVEEFLSNKINECFGNTKFNELPISVICRIIERSNKENLNMNLLIDFILESLEARFTLLKFVELYKLNDEKLNQLIDAIDDQIEQTRLKCLEFLPFDFVLIKQMRSKYDEFESKFNNTKKELEQTKQQLTCTNEELEQTKQKSNQLEEELERTKQQFKQSKEELEQTKQQFIHTNEELKQTKQKSNELKEELERTKQQFKQTKVELEQDKHQFIQAKEELDQKNHQLNNTKVELEQIKQQLMHTKEELEQAKQKSSQMKEELEQAKLKLNHTKEDFKQIKQESKQKKAKQKQSSQSIVVVGFNRFNQLGEKSNSKDEYGTPIISPPQNLSFDPSSLLSISIFESHSVLITDSGSILGVGFNSDNRISSSLPKTKISQFTVFSIKDSKNRQLTPISAVCILYGTLYMFSKSSGKGSQLVYCDCEINGGNPVFLDIGDQQPVALFGGYLYAASISSEGKIIFVNHYSVKNSPESRIEAISLPDGEKASSVACLVESIVVLSTSGRVFSSSIIKGSNALCFSDVEELTGEEIVSVSGTYNHCFAVNREGKVFGRGSNEGGQLGLDEGTKSAPYFIEISSLSGYEIKAAYAGCSHSLFQTREGKILSCGSNRCGNLLLSSGPGKSVYSPVETTINSGATFCIAGPLISAVFICSDPPPHTPNMRIK